MVLMCFQDDQRIRHKIQKEWKFDGKFGEADRTVPNLMPKHLYTGKRGAGKNERR